MNTKRSLIRAGAVLATAFAAGHLMQTLHDRPVATAALDRPINVERVSAGDDALRAAPTGLPQADHIAPEVKTIADLPQVASLTDDAAALPKTLPAPVSKAAAMDCKPQMDLAAGAQQMIAVTITAPCLPDGRVVLRHGGLVVAEALDAKGGLMIDLPAMTADGAVSALFTDASIATGALPMPGVARIQRFAVQWMADDRFQLHAMENGAAYGTPGHLWADNPVSPAGGYLIALGNPALDLPMMAEVYTWPADGQTRAHPVIEAEVTEMTCGRELLGETLLLSGGKVSAEELNLAMPDCAALGDILVLNNLVPDTTLATAN